MGGLREEPQPGLGVGQAPLTLAETIRRKITESNKIPDGAEDQQSSDKWNTQSGTEAGGAPSDWSQGRAPNSFGNPDTGMGMQGGADQWNQPPAASQSQFETQHPGSSIGLAPPPGGIGLSQGPISSGGMPTPQGQAAWQSAPPKGHDAVDDDSEWGPPPAGGAWEEGPSPAQAPANNQFGAPASGSSWGQPAAFGSTSPSQDSGFQPIQQSSNFGGMTSSPIGLAPSAPMPAPAPAPTQGQSQTSTDSGWNPMPGPGFSGGGSWGAPPSTPPAPAPSPAARPVRPSWPGPRPCGRSTPSGVRCGRPSRSSPG